MALIATSKKSRRLSLIQTLRKNENLQVRSEKMSPASCIFPLFVAFATLGCVGTEPSPTWKNSVNQQVNQLGYRNWIVIAEASFPAHNKPGIRQVYADAEVPEVVDYVLSTIEDSQNVRPRVYLTRELRAVENDFAPGIDTLREQIKKSLQGHEPTELEQRSLITLIEAANKNFQVLVIRTPTALPYTSVFLELQPGYWDSESEDRLRETIKRQRMESLAKPTP